MLSGLRNLKSAGFAAALTASFTVSEALGVEAAHRLTSIPHAVREFAAAKLVNLKNLDYKNGRWVVCNGNACELLNPPGRSVVTLPAPDPHGIEEKIGKNYIQGSGPEFEKALIKHLKASTDKHLLIVVSVPPECQSCRNMDPQFKSFAVNNSGNKNVQVAVIHFDNFDAAYKFLGDKPARFDKITYPYIIATSPNLSKIQARPPSSDAQVETYRTSFADYVTKLPRLSITPSIDYADGEGTLRRASELTVKHYDSNEKK